MTDTALQSREIWQVDDGRAVEAPVRRVVALEDRAQVTRRAELHLDAGVHRLLAPGVTPLVADRTLRCRAQPLAADGATAPRVRESRVLRRYLVRAARPEKEIGLRDAIEARTDEYREVSDRASTRWHERDLVLAAHEALTHQVQTRLSVGAFDDDTPAAHQRLRAARAALEAELLALQWDQEDRRRRIHDLVQELNLALAPIPDYQAALVCEVAIATPGTYRIEWEYLVACALWRPEYTAELDTAAQKLRWVSAGTVWQATGEEWKGIELCFSTARPTLGAELPLLADDTLSTRDKSEEEKKVIQVTSRDETISTTKTAPEKKESDTPPGLDDGGETRTFVVPQPVDIGSDGRPHRVLFEEWQAAVETERCCLAEKAAYVFLRSLQQNGSALPLLAGPVTLVRDGGFVGRSAVGYIAPRERFGLSWGSEDGVVVLRDVQRRYEEKGLRKHHLYQFTIKDYLANQTTAPVRLKLTERVPVSEIEQVVVSVDERATTAGSTRDAQGHLTWEKELGPGAETTVNLIFTVEMPQNVRWDG